MKFIKQSGIVAPVALVALLVTSPASAIDVKGLYKAGFDFGGDTLRTLQFTDGSTEDVKGSEGFYIGGGVSLVSDDKTLETEISLSYKFVKIDATNGNVKFTRWPIDALVFYRWPKVRAGGGITYHLNPELDGSGVVSNIDVDYKNSLGFVLQADWRITDKLNLGARYTILDYEEKNTGDKKDANGIGIVFSGSF